MRLHKRISLLIVAVALLGATGCAPKRIGAAYDPFFLFPATAQWAWDEGLNRIPNDPALTELNIRRIVRDLITEGLAERGYTMAPKGGEVDFRIHYEIGIGRRIEPGSVEGFASLSLNFVDVATDRDVWLGFVRTEVAIAITEAERRKRLRSRIEKMLGKFPPNQPK